MDPGLTEAEMHTQQVKAERQHGMYETRMYETHGDKAGKLGRCP